MKKITLLCVLLLLIACKNKTTEVKEIPFQFGINNAEPNLVSQNGKLALSWINSIRGKEATLFYSQLENNSWKKPINITSGNNWFVNWADFPANATNGNLLLTSHLQMSAQGTYTYDIVLNLRELNGKIIKKNFLLNTDKIKAEHGFVSIIPNKKDGFFITWLDGRNTVKKMEDNHHKAMTIRVAEVSKEGVIYNETQLDERTCDCCQTSITMTNNGPVIVYRDRSNEEIRDIYIVRKVHGVWTKPLAVHNDNWKIAGCPVNGPKVVSNNNNVAVAWFSAANNTPTVKVAFSFDGGKNFKKPISISKFSVLGRVDVLFLNSNEVLVSYIEKDKKGTFLKCKKITLKGIVSNEFIISEIGGNRGTGVPQLELFKNEIYAVWTVSKEKKNQLKSVKFSFEEI